MEAEAKTRISKEVANVPISLIIDKSGRIIALGQEFQDLFPNAAPHSDFFELFSEENNISLQKLFIDARKFESLTTDNFEVSVKGGKINFAISFLPLRSENNVYFLITFKQAGTKKNATEVQKFWVATADLEKIVENKKLLGIVNKIKLTYPFTFIEKAKIQKEINELDEYFWIKGTNGKYILVNDRFAESSGSKPSQLENKSAEDFLPKYLLSLYKFVDQYLIESTNAVILDGISLPILGGAERSLSLVEFPLCDLDNNVVAIIGFSKKSDTLTKKESPKIELDLIYHLPLAVLLINRENRVLAYSQEFVRLMELDEKSNLYQSDVNRILEKGLMPFIESYRKNAELRAENVFNYMFIEKLKLNSEVRLKKIFDTNGELWGTQISFMPKLEQDALIDLKAKMYDAIIENTNEAMFIYEIENLKFLEVNNAALKLYGYKRNDFLHMDLTDLYAPEDIQTIIQSGDSKSIPGSYSGPWRHKKNDGASVLVEINRSTIEYKGKKAHLNIIRDVSDNADAKKKLQMLEAYFDHTTDPILVTDKDGFINEINEPVTKRLGYSKKDLELRPFVSLVSDENRAKINKNIFHSGLLKTTSFEIEIKKPSGTLHKALLIATPIKNVSGDIESFSLLVRPLEEAVQSKDIKQTLEDTLHRIDPPFLSNVFHEILTPINVILGFTQELGESIPSPNDEQKEAVEIIKENQKLLLQIMDNAVEYSTLEQKIIKFRPEEIKFVDLLNELKENTRKSAESRKIDVTYGKISSSLVIETDKQKFMSLLVLFIKFAIQITKENTIYLSASTYQDNYCAIGIKDGRSAITSYLQKAFTDIFSEDENLSRRNYGFSRFSVKLAKKLIELLSVKREVITKDSEPHEFALLFPLKFVVGDKEKMEVESVAAKKVAEVKPKTEKLPEQKAAEAQVEPVVKKELAVSQLSCLYLEDQVDSQLLFKVQMKDLKGIEFAPSFETALPLLKTKKFDFIIMDINLQGEYNGLDALRIIRKMTGYKDIPIIASTAYLQPGARESFINAGFTEFVSKPMLREKLLEVLKKIFE